MSEQPKQIGTLFGRPIVLTAEGMPEPTEPLYFMSLEDWHKQQIERLRREGKLPAATFPVPEEGL